MHLHEAISAKYSSKRRCHLGQENLDKSPMNGFVSRYQEKVQTHSSPSFNQEKKSREKKKNSKRHQLHDDYKYNNLNIIASFHKCLH